MFFLPLGDDVNHRELPLGGLVLVILNVLVLTFMLRLAFEYPKGPQVMNFVRTWGLVPADLAQGHYRGLVTYMFLHGGIFHLVGNLFFFWAFVHSLEASLGTVRFLLLYLVWGVVAGLAHALTVWGGFVPMVGASGAIGGMIGAYWVAFGPLTRIRTLVYFFGIHIYRIPAGAFIFFWLVMQVAGAIEPKTLSGGGIAWFAHLGGFGAGALSMVCLGRFRKAKLTQDSDGVMQFAPVVREVAEPLPAPEPEFPERCPYCATPVDPRQHQLAPNLLRCPNPSCARCIYLEVVS